MLSLVFLGCIEETPVGTPAPAATPFPAQTPLPTVIPTTQITSPAVTPEIALPVKYIVWIDSDYGFYRVRAVSGNTSIRLLSNFDMLNFTINTGDKIRWINDDSYDYPLTIVSNEGLWTNRTGYMRWQGDRFEYTFNETGNYTFSIKEYKRIKHQKIVVKPQ